MSGLLNTTMRAAQVRIPLAAKRIASCCSVLLLFPAGAGAAYREHAVTPPSEYGDERLVGLLSVIALTSLAWLYEGHDLPNNRTLYVTFTALVFAIALTGGAPCYPCP